MARRHVYQRMTPQQLAEALKRAGVTAAEFAYHTGMARDRVLRCLEGKEDVPPACWFFVTALLFPGFLAHMREITPRIATPKGDD